MSCLKYTPLHFYPRLLQYTSEQCMVVTCEEFTMQWGRQTAVSAAALRCPCQPQCRGMGGGAALLLGVRGLWGGGGVLPDGEG